MTEPQGAPGLEAALLERAERLAEEVIGRARDGAAGVVRDQRQRLRSREERTSKEAAADADRAYRRKVQAAELRLQGELDRQRWDLIGDVLDELPRRLGEVMADRDDGERLVVALLAHAAAALPDGELVAELGDRDHERLADRWPDIVRQAAPGRRVELAETPHRSSGGVRVTGDGGRVRIDATFEGRIEQRRGELVAEVAERLFAHDPGRG